MHAWIDTANRELRTCSYATGSADVSPDPPASPIATPEDLSHEPSSRENVVCHQGGGSFLEKRIPGSNPTKERASSLRSTAVAPPQSPRQGEARLAQCRSFCTGKRTRESVKRQQQSRSSKKMDMCCYLFLCARTYKHRKSSSTIQSPSSPNLPDSPDRRLLISGSH